MCGASAVSPRCPRYLLTPRDLERDVLSAEDGFTKPGFTRQTPRPDARKAMKTEQASWSALSVLLRFESVHIDRVYIILGLNMYTDECVYRYIFAICIIPCIFIHTQLDIVRNLVKQSQSTVSPTSVSVRSSVISGRSWKTFVVQDPEQPGVPHGGRGSSRAWQVSDFTRRVLVTVGDGSQQPVQCSQCCPWCPGHPYPHSVSHGEQRAQRALKQRSVQLNNS